MPTSENQGLEDAVSELAERVARLEAFAGINKDEQDVDTA